jgi:hypothetical protein
MGDEAADTHPRKRSADERTERLCHVAAAPPFAREHESQLGLPARFLEREDEAGPDGVPAGAVGHDELVREARLLIASHALEPRARVAQISPGRIGKELRHVLVTVYRHQRSKVGLGDGAHFEARRPQSWRDLEGHAAMLRGCARRFFAP